MSDRKYRHRGYMDSGGRRDDAPRERSGPPRPRGEGPRGRSVGTEANAVFKCNACGEKVRSLDEVDAESVCARCGQELHTCSHCSHYDPQARFQCTEEIPERIAKKLKKNECEFFAPKVVLDLTGDKPKDADDARSAFDKLFK